MVRYVFKQIPDQPSWGISEVNAAGLGRRHSSVTFDSSVAHKDGEAAARLLALALGMDGGIGRAVELLRSQAAGQQRG